MPAATNGYPTTSNHTLIAATSTHATVADAISRFMPSPPGEVRPAILNIGFTARPL
jgi:hypothetical protein